MFVFKGGHFFAYFGIAPEMFTIPAGARAVRDLSQWRCSAE
jgi:hypothetical protein